MIYIYIYVYIYTYMYDMVWGGGDSGGEESEGWGEWEGVGGVRSKFET